MRIIIAGLGSAGTVLTDHITREGHDVTVIDSDPEAVHNVTDRFDANGIIGNAATVSTQNKAGIDGADLLIAVTGSDELNLLCCAVAKRCGVRHTIARVRRPEYSADSSSFASGFGVDMTVNPELDTAEEIARLIRFPGVLNIDTFAGGKVDITGVSVDKGSVLDGAALKGIRDLLGADVLLCTVMRGDQLVIPKGGFTLREGDRVSIAAPSKELSKLFDKLGLISRPVKRVMMTGCGRIGFYLCETLDEMKLRLTIVESSAERCRELSERFPNVKVVLGSGTEAELIESEGLDKYDAMISLTGSDETNMVSSLLAWSKKVPNIITKIDDAAYARLLQGIDIDHTVSPYFTTVSGVLRYLRGISQSASGTIKTLYKLGDGRAEAVEFDVGEGFPKIGIPLMSKELRLRSNVLIASIVRDGEVIVPKGSSTLEKGDSVVVISTRSTVKNLSDILD